MTQKEKDKYKQFLEETGSEKDALHYYMKWKCLTDLYWLGSNIFGLKDAFDKSFGKPRRVLDPKFHGWMVNIINRDEDKLILVPRRHMKSTWIKYRIIQKILRNPNIRIGLYSVTTGLVRAMLADIKRLIQTPSLRELFPEVIPPVNEWEINTQDRFCMKRDPELGHIPQEAQVEVYGVGSAVVGRHFDEHYYDDLIDRDSVRSLEQIRKTRDWYAHIQGVLEPNGLETMIGTHYHYQDLYSELIREKFYKNIYRRPAIEKGKPVYSYFTLAMLNRNKKRMGEYVFSCQYMNDPTPKEEMIFPPPQPIFDVLPGGEHTYYITVDPAATIKKHSDETAIIVAALNKQKRLYILEAIHFKRPGNYTAQRIIELNEKYNPVKIGIEFGLQEHLKYIIESVRGTMERQYNKKIILPIEALKIGHQSKYDRVNWTLGSAVRQGTIQFKSDLNDLFMQMERFSPNYEGYDDLIDACSMLFPLIKGFHYRKQNDNLFTQVGFYITDFFKKKPYRCYEDRF